MPESDFKYTSIRMHKKINSKLEEIRSVVGCSMNALCVALLDSHVRVLMIDLDLKNDEDKETLMGNVQQILSEVDH